MPRDGLDALLRSISNHQKWRLKECLNLIPSENMSSRLLRSMFMTDLGNRYSAPDMFYRGTRYADEVHSTVEKLARRVFRAKFADVRPLSGHTADMAVLLGTTHPGDKVLSVSPDNGGYPGVSHLGLGRLLGLRNLYFPYDDKSVNIEEGMSEELMKAEKPDVVFFGASFIPFPHPTRRLTPFAPGRCVFDGSHVLGLVAGGQFQDPLREGCSLLVASTHKSLPGPQGGIILSNDEVAFSKVSGSIHPGIVDNIHLNRVAALGVVLQEMLEFGRDYARAVVRNSQALAQALASAGVKVRGAKYGYTKSHQVLLDYGASELFALSRRLEGANIISDDGGRLGTSELTRMGYGEEQMVAVAELISVVVKGKERPRAVAKRVKALVGEFQRPKYVLKRAPPF